MDNWSGIHVFILSIIGLIGGYVSWTYGFVFVLKILFSLFSFIALAVLLGLTILFTLGDNILKGYLQNHKEIEKLYGKLNEISNKFKKSN